MEEEFRNKITLEKNIPQEGVIKVAAQIIDDLSSGIYSSPASCIKELINNSFDADANLVTLRIKPAQDTITILDDGCGMNANDFDENFAWISKSNKRNRGEFSKKGRPLIGKIGIGFIAVNEICEGLEITSSKNGEDIKFSAIVNFSKSSEEDGRIKANYTLTNSDEEKGAHYTSIRLTGLKKEITELLHDQQYFASKFAESSKRKNYFKNMEDVLLESHKQSPKSFTKASQYIQFILDLASYIPVEYIKGGPIEGSNDKIIKGIIDRHKRFNFKVDMDGIYLKKPIFFEKQNNERTTCQSFKQTLKVGEHSLKFEGYLYAKNSLLYPRELNGVAIRVRNIPIAPRFGFDTSFLNYPLYTDQLFANWISGEIYIENGLEDAMNIDRQSFRVTHPDYVALQAYLHKFLKEDFFPKRVKLLYEEGRMERDKEKKIKEEDIIKRVLGTRELIVEEKENLSRPVIVSARTNKLVVELNKKYFKEIPKNKRVGVQNILIIFEESVKESRGSVERLRDIFVERIKDWLGD